VSFDIQIKIDPTGAVPEITKVKDELGKTEEKAKSLSQRLNEAATKSVEEFAKRIVITPESIMEGVHAAQELVDEYHKVSDELIELDNSMQKFTSGFRTTNEVIQQQIRLANELHTTASKVVQVYDNVGDATDSLNLSIEEQEALTVTLGKSAKLAGEGIDSVGGSLQGLSVAWETGGNVGKQLRSFLRDNHDLALALSDTLHMTTRQIIDAAQDGSLTYGKFVDGVIKSEPQLNETFKKIKKTHVEWEAQYKEGFEVALRAGGDFVDAMLDGMNRADDALQKNTMTFGVWFEDLQRKLDKIQDDAKRQTAGWDAAKPAAEGIQGFFQRLPVVITATQAAFEKLHHTHEVHKKDLIDIEAYIRKDLEAYNAQIRVLAEMDAKQKKQAEHELEGIDELNKRRLAQMEREEQMDKAFRDEATKHDQEEDKLRKEKVQKEQEAAEKTREAWGEATGKVTGDFIRMMMEGKKSTGELVEYALQQLALVALKQAATSMGGPYGAFFGAAISAFGGGMTGFDYTVPNSNLALPGFATGGDFTVGGAGGVDRTLVAFRATPGETVHVRTPEQGPVGGGSGTPKVAIFMQNNRRDLTDGMDSSDGERVLVKLDRKLGRQRRR